MHHTVLFVCPHNAAKSVLAAAYFQRLAQQHGLDVQVRSGGTDPDAQIAPAVAALLHAEGVDITGQRPRALTQADLDAATHVVALSCPLDQFDLTHTVVEGWDDVPPASDNLHAARDAILAHVQQLIRDLRERG